MTEKIRNENYSLRDLEIGDRFTMIGDQRIKSVYLLIGFLLKKGKIHRARIRNTATLKEIQKDPSLTIKFIRST